MKNIYFTAGILLLCCCKKSPMQPPVDPLLQVAYEHGIASGRSMFKTIGPEGDSLNTIDGKMMLIIPPGVLTEVTFVGIRTITNMLPGSVGKSYRLYPENIAFSKPIEIIYTYTTAELTAAPKGVLYLASQNKEGYWTVLNKTQMDKDKHTLKIGTTYLADYTTYPGK